MNTIIEKTEKLLNQAETSGEKVYLSAFLDGAKAQKEEDANILNNISMHFKAQSESEAKSMCKNNNEIKVRIKDKKIAENIEHHKAPLFREYCKVHNLKNGDTYNESHYWDWLENTPLEERKLIIRKYRAESYKEQLSFDEAINLLIEVEDEIAELCEKFQEFDDKINTKEKEIADYMANAIAKSLKKIVDFLCEKGFVTCSINFGDTNE